MFSIKKVIATVKEQKDKIVECQADITIFGKRAGVEKFAKDNEGNMSPQAIVSIVIAAVLIGVLLPVGIGALNDANTTGWSATQLALYGLVGVAILIAIVIALFKGKK